MKPTDDELDALLKRLHLANARRIWRQLVERAEKEEWSYRDFLALLVAEEIAQRQQTRLGRLSRRASFPFFKTIDDFNFTYQSTLRLSLLGSALSPDFITEGRCLILSGKPGRGKTHLAVAIAYRAIQNGFDAFFITAAELIDDLSAAFRRDAGRGPRHLHPSRPARRRRGRLSHLRDRRRQHALPPDQPTGRKGHLVLDGQCASAAAAVAPGTSGLHPLRELREHLDHATEEPTSVAVGGGRDQASAKRDVQHGRALHRAAACDQVEVRLLGTGVAPTALRDVRARWTSWRAGADPAATHTPGAAGHARRTRRTPARRGTRRACRHPAVRRLRRSVLRCWPCVISFRGAASSRLSRKKPRGRGPRKELNGWKHGSMQPA